MDKGVRESIAVISAAAALGIVGGALLLVGRANSPDEPLSDDRTADIVGGIGGLALAVAVLMAAIALVRIAIRLTQSSDEDVDVSP